MRALALLLGAALLAEATVAPAAAAPRLRDGARIEDGQIRIGDIWEGAGARSAVVVGPAPPPGRHIVVEAPQLAYIARLFDVPWRPASPAERIIIERAGVPVPRAAIVAVLRRALAEAGLAADTELELPDLETPILPATARLEPVVEGFHYEPGSGRFTAVLAYPVSGLPTQRQRVSGRAVVVRTVAVATRRLAAGTVLAPGDVQAARLPAARLPATALPDPRQALGQAMRRPVGPGEPLTAADLGPPALIEAGQSVQLSLETNGIHLAASGVALASGGLGERIRVRNAASHAILEAVVTGPGTARVAPGAVPLSPPRAGATLPAAR